jgi:hypothetical protein
MTMLEFWRGVARLSDGERRELNAFMVRVCHESPEWKRMISRRMLEVEATLGGVWPGQGPAVQSARKV